MFGNLFDLFIYFIMSAAPVGKGGGLVFSRERRAFD